MEELKDKITKQQNLEAQEDVQIEQEMKALAEQYQKKHSDTENGLSCIKHVDFSIQKLENKHHKFYLKHEYLNARTKQSFAMVTLVKGILTQRKRFFAISRDLLLKLVQEDPDNTNKAAALKWKAIERFMRDRDICRLWNAKERKTAGYVVLDQNLIRLMKIDNETSKQQFSQLKLFCNNDWVNEDMVFNESGECKVKIDEHIKLIEAHEDSMTISELEEKKFFEGLDSFFKESSKLFLELKKTNVTELRKEILPILAKNLKSLSSNKLYWLNNDIFADRIEDFMNNKSDFSSKDMAEIGDIIYDSSYEAKIISNKK